MPVELCAGFSDAVLMLLAITIGEFVDDHQIDPFLASIPRGWQQEATSRGRYIHLNNRCRSLL